MKVLPIANFSALRISERSRNFAIKLLQETNKVFSKGSGNNYLDLMQNPLALANFIYVKFKDNDVAIPDNYVPDITRLNNNDQEFYQYIYENIITSYKHNIGTCGDMASVSLFLASIYGKETLLSISLMSLKYNDHCLIKLEFENDSPIFIDPWFKNKDAHGAIFTLDDAKQYYLNIADILSKSLQVNIIIVMAVISAAFIALKMQDLTHGARLFAMSILQPILVLVAIQAYYALQKSYLEPKFNTMLTIYNNNQKQNVTFNLVQNVCNHKLKSLNIPQPLIFSPRSMNEDNQQHESAAKTNINSVDYSGIVGRGPRAAPTQRGPRAAPTQRGPRAAPT